MKSGQEFAVDDSRTHLLIHELAGRHASGFSDALGDRTLILGAQNEPILELLCFRRGLATPGFEVALRRRVERLKHFRHPAFVRTPTVELLGEHRGLSLLSSYTPGRRLSDLLDRAQDEALAASIIHQLTPALDALNEYSDGVGHGALTADRIVIGPTGHATIVEHVLASALERLHLTAAAMRTDLGIPVPSTEPGPVRLEGPTDCYQLALVALSMLLGRPLNADDFSDLATALTSAVASSDGIEAPAGLREWLERALLINGRGFASTAEAKIALHGLSPEQVERASDRWRQLATAVETESVARVVPLEEPAEELPPPDNLEILPVEPPPETIHIRANEDIPIEALPEPAPTPPAPEQSSFRIDDRIRPSPRRHQAGPAPTTRDYLRWAVVALGLVVLAQAVTIGLLLRGRTSPPPPSAVAQVSLATDDPGAPVMVDGRLAGITPLDLTISPEMRSISVATPRLPARQDLIVGSTGQQARPADVPTESPGARSREAPAAPPLRIGALRVAAPIELEIFEGTTRVGSTAAGIVSVPAGRHELELVNNALGFRSRQSVEVKPGQTVALTVSPPNGRLNINAVPWAEVLIDGKSVGETPIGNVSLSLGEHEIVFRHPQLGELRRTAIVRADAVTRVSVNLER